MLEEDKAVLLQHRTNAGLIALILHDLLQQIGIADQVVEITVGIDQIVGREADILGIHHNAFQGCAQLFHLLHQGIDDITHLTNIVVHKDGVLGCQTEQLGRTEEVDVAAARRIGLQLCLQGLCHFGHFCIGVDAIFQTNTAIGQVCIFATVGKAGRDKTVQIGVFGFVVVRPAHEIERLLFDFCSLGRQAKACGDQQSRDQQ